MKRIEAILSECLDEIKAGTATVEDCLDRYPARRDELEPLLKIALDVGELPVVTPSAGFKARARAGVMEYAREHPVHRPRWRWLAEVFVRPAWARVTAIVVAVLMVLAGSATGTAYASQSSLPGDLLYPVKTATESVREWVETDAAGDARLQMEFAGHRLDEMAQLLESSPDNLATALTGYEKNLNKALAYAGLVPADAVATTLADDISGQLNRLDALDDADGGDAVAEAQRIAVGAHVQALRRVAADEPVRASEMIITALQDRLEKASGAASHGNTVRAENALRLFNQYAALGEEVGNEAAGTAFETPVAALFQQAVQEQQQLFASFAAHVSAQVAGEVQQSFQKMEQAHGQHDGNGQSGAGNQDGNTGNQGEGNGAPGETPGHQDETSVDQGASGDPTATGGVTSTPDNQNDDPGHQPEEPGNPGQGPDSPGA